MSIQASYRLSTPQVESVLDMLEREERSYPVTVFERVFYLLLQFFIAGSVLSGVAFVVVAWVRRDEPDVGTTEWTPLALYLGSSLLAIGCFIVNLFFAKRFIRRLRLLRRLGVRQVLDDPWRAERRRRGFAQFLSALLLILGSIGTLLSLSFLALWLLIALFGVATRAEFLSGALWISFVLMSSLVLVGFYFLRRARLLHRLVSEASRLRQDLASRLVAGSTEVAIEARTHQQLAAIERAQIRRTRAEAIQTRLSGKGLPDYAILKSQTLIEQQARLEPESILAVEYAIQSLASKPRPEPAVAHDKTLVLPVANTGSELAYEVDDQAQRIFVRELRGGPELRERDRTRPGSDLA